MKRNLLFLFILIMLFTSCTKEDKVSSIDISSIEPVYKYDGSDDIEIDSKYKVNHKISENYFLVIDENEKYNLMDINGNLLLNDFYLSVGNFSDGLAPVIEGENRNDKNIKRYYINNKGEIAIDKVDNREMVLVTEFKYGFSGIVLKENENSLSETIGYLTNNSSEIRGYITIDTNGNIISVGLPKLENVYSNWRKKIVYEKGKVLDGFGLSQEFVTLDKHVNKGDIIFYSLGDIFGLYDKNKDEILTQPLYSWACMQPFVDGKIYAFKENYINDNLELVLLDESGKELKKINKYGRLRKKEIKIDSNKSEITYNVSLINDNKIVANFDKVSVVLDMDGNEILKSKYRNLLDVEENGMISFYDEKTGKYGLINLNDELILKGYDRISNVCNNTILLTKDGKTVIHKLKN